MTDNRIAAINALLFLLFWLLVLLAGADFPPPRGFLWVVLTVATCAGVVYRRVPAYLAWHRERRAGRHARALLEGAVAGLLVALPFALLGSGEPSVTMEPVDYAIWFGVPAGMGMLNALVLYLINTWPAGSSATGAQE